MSGVNRRDFLQGGAAALLARYRRPVHPADAGTTPQFSTTDAGWQSTYDRALAVLAGNVQMLPRFDRPVLIEGANYAGVWLECGPHEGLVYRRFRPDVARNNHLTFFALQREDGQIPANNKRTEAGLGQIQMVVPIAATAWELARATGDDELLQRAYASCSRWDDWLMRYRNTRGTGLVEGFCTYDTGHDNSPRWAGMPNQCPGKDAKVLPPDHGLPRLCPDLSSTVYGGRVALARMARALGKQGEEDLWAERAEKIRKLIIEKLYVPEDGAFYDLDAHGRFIRIRSDVLSRVCGEHVVTQPIFESMWQKQLHNPAAFWAAYPLPSIALDDPSFVRPIPANSWGGASQALTALRAPRWLEHYGKPAQLAFLMKRWCEAIQRDGTFRQQLDPATGVFTEAGPPGYSPAALVMIDFTWRLAGIREEEDSLEWNVRPDPLAAHGGRFSIPFDRHHSAAMHYDSKGATLSVDDRHVARIEGGTVRLTTDRSGRPRRFTGISEKTEEISVRFAAEPARKIAVRPNQTVQL